MLNISGLNSGYVIDHIPAGLSMSIYNYLNLGKYDHQIAIIKNAKSSKMGKKDIIKIEGIPEDLNLELLSIFLSLFFLHILVFTVLRIVRLRSIYIISSEIKSLSSYHGKYHNSII